MLMMQDPLAAFSPTDSTMGDFAPSHHAACTIVSPNYLGFARTLAASYLAHHPGHRFFVLIVADAVDPAAFHAAAPTPDPFTPVFLPQLGLPDLRSIAMLYDILELNTNVKPTFLKHLLATYPIDKLTYLDPDIFVHAPLVPVFTALDACDAVLTPHMTTPVFDGHTPSEQDILYNGTYNLGFFAIRRSPGAARILDWWERRCLDLGFSEGRSGLFVDQKWMNLAPGLFENIAILRHPGCNMAFWNLHERYLAQSATGYVVNRTESLCFFHFSGITPSDPTQLSKNTDRFTLATRPDLQPLFDAYRAALQAAADPTRERLPYGFAAFSDGTAVTRLSRRIYAQHRAHFPQPDPFDATGPWLAFCRREKLVAGTAPPIKASWQEFSGVDRRVLLVHRLLRLTLRALGPNRYELLMRYVAHIAVLRHQSVFLNRGLPRT